MKKALHAKPFRLQMPGHTPRHARPEPARSKLLRGVSLCLAAVCLAASVSFQPATAATSMASLQNKLNSLSKSIDQHKKELSDAKKKEAAAKALESELKERVGVIQDQISVLSTQIAAVQNNIGQTEQKITAKEAEITQKQTEIDGQWGDFKKHMAAMQELRDGGSVAMLSAVNDLYELLTFNEVMQDISIKDTEIMDNMKAAKSELEADKVELEAQRKALDGQVRREDVIRRLGELAFGRPNDCVRLVLEERPEVEKLDLSLLSEIKRSEKGALELKLLDRLAVLEQLAALTSKEDGTMELLQALGNAGEAL